MDKSKKGDRLTYAAAGVNIGAGAEVVERIRAAVASTVGDKKLIGGLGGFAGLVELPELKEPVLVSAADGVGTKVLIAESLGSYSTVGIDLVAMSVNDILTAGARPLFFLDYLAVGNLDPEKAASLVEGIAEGCRRAGCVLLGGETAEMPDLYRGGEFDLAGFAVGVVEKGGIIDGSGVQAGDILVGLPSSGLHSNGFSLVRAALEKNGIAYTDEIAGLGSGPVGEELLKPTVIYAEAVSALLGSCRVRAMAHITGGGLVENIPRVIPEGLGARIDKGSWQTPPVFTAIQQLGNVAEAEMFKTFNMGIGFVAVVLSDDREKALAAAPGSVIIGEIISKGNRMEIV